MQGLLSAGSVEDLLGECRLALEEALAKIERAMGTDSGSRTGTRLMKRALWPLKKQETLDLVAKIERMKTKLTMTLTTVSTQLVLRQQAVVDDVSSNVQQIATHLQFQSSQAKRQQVLDWLTQHNPDVAHQRAVKEHCRDTCSWILKENTFQQWLHPSDHSALWISGLVGYGKTVMTSFVIQYLLDALAQSRMSLAYYYFDANDTNSLSLRTFIASIVRQYCTCMPGLPDRVLNEFDAQKARYGSSRQLEIEGLASILDDLLSSQAANIIVVDGVDESQEQEDICEYLNSLAASGGLVHLFVSSRPEAAIRRQLTHFTEMQLSQTALEHDIGRYVNFRMKVEPRLARLSSQLKQHVQTTIRERSHGMFRWAQLQLDDVAKLRTDRSVRQALNFLPQNLGDLYSLMLSRIPPADVDLAKKALMFLVHSPALLNIKTIAEAAVFEPKQGSIDPDDRLGDPTDILEICGSLVAFDPVVQEIRLAHHSVRECLERLQADQSVFAMPDPFACHRDMAVACLSYLLMDDFSGGIKRSTDELKELVHSFPLVSYAAQQVCYHIIKSDCENELQPLILQLFSKEPNPKFLLWLQVVYWSTSVGRFQHPDGAALRLLQGSRAVQPQPLYYAASYGLEETVKSLVRVGAEMNKAGGRFGGTALHAAFWRGHPEIARFLLESGINPSFRDLNGMEALEFAHDQEDPIFTELALAYRRHHPAIQIPESLTSAVSQAYQHQRLASTSGQIRNKPLPARFMTSSHKQHWQSQQAKKPEDTKDQIFEMG